MDGGAPKKKPEKQIINVTVRPLCVCGHNTMYHPTIMGSNRRFACGKVGCECKKWRPVQSMNIHKGSKS